MNDLLRYLPDRGKLPICDYWEIRLEFTTRTAILLKNGEVESINLNDNLLGNVRILEKGGWGFITFAKPEELVRFFNDALSFARSVGGGDSRVSHMPACNIQIATNCEKHPNDIDLPRKLELAKEYNAILQAHAGAVLSETSYGDVVRHTVYWNSENRLIEQREVMTNGGVTITGKVNGTPENMSKSFRYRAGFESFERFNSGIAQMLDEFDILMQAKDAKGGTYNCLLDQRIAGVFVHEAFGHTSEADGFLRDKRMQEVMKLGKPLGSEVLNIYDDATYDPMLGGSIPFDEEGIEGHKTVLLDRGIIENHLHSRETSALLGESITGNARALSASYPPIVRMTNTYIAPGKASKDDLLKEMQNGVLVMGSRGGMGGEDFTFNAMYGFLVENGKLTQPIKNFTLTGNLFATLKNIVACSRELKVDSSAGGCGKAGQMPLPVGLGGPYVLVNNALIGGR